MKILVTAPIVLGTLLVLVGQPTDSDPIRGANNAAVAGVSAVALLHHFSKVLT